MRVYTVHERAWSAAADRDAVLVREGFSWAAALFGAWWAVAHGLWRAALALTLVEALLAALLVYGEPDEASAIALVLGYRILVGYLANDLRRAALRRSGHVFRGVVAAPTRDAAEHRFLGSRSGGAAAYE